MSNLTKEDLEYHIADIGFELTLTRYHVTEKEADVILNGKVYGESDRFKFVKPKSYTPLCFVFTADSLELYRVISEHYGEIYKRTVLDKWTINNRSMSKEDTFHNSLLSILKSAESFIYESDDVTLHMINKTIKNTSLNELRDCELAKEKTEQFKNLHFLAIGI